MAEITKTKDQRPKTKDRIIWLLLALIIVFIYFFGLTIPLLGPDEPRYAQVAREMFERGDWITPKLGGFDWFEKPALLYWLQIFFFKLFGVSEFAARLGSALFGLGTILSLWILGKSVQSKQFKVQSEDTEDQTPKTEFGNWLALIAAPSIGLLSCSRGASFDLILALPITAAHVAYFLFDQKALKSGFGFYFIHFIFYFCFGGAIIAIRLVGL